MSLFIKKYKTSYGKTHCSIVDGYRVNGKIKHKTIKKYGYLEDLEKQFDDPIEFLNSELANLKKEFETKITATFDKKEFNTFDDDTFNIGYAYLKTIFQELNISNVLKNKQYSTNIEYSLSKACELLTYARIIDPGSIKYIYEHKNHMLFYWNDFIRTCSIFIL